MRHGWWEVLSMDTGYRLSDIFLFNGYNRDFFIEWQMGEMKSWRRESWTE
jgi:hypothetical protein